MLASVVVCLAAAAGRSPHPTRHRRRNIEPVLCSAEAPAPTFADEFSDALPQWLIDRAAALGFETPTPVQSEALGVVLQGRDAIVQAKTGSGKTLSYMLPLLAMLEPRSSVQALVLLPTRELASQVAIVARRLLAADFQVKILALSL
jgi:Superfamily II DNA and RNA helicases